MTLSPATLGALRSLAIMLLMATLTWLADSAHLSGVVSVSLAGFISMIAGALEQALHSSTGSAMFGAVQLRK